jgi:hypothetical protein
MEHSDAVYRCVQDIIIRSMDSDSCSVAVAVCVCVCVWRGMGRVTSGFDLI